MGLVLAKTDRFCAFRAMAEASCRHVAELQNESTLLDTRKANRLRRLTSVSNDVTVLAWFFATLAKNVATLQAKGVEGASSPWPSVH